MNWAELFGFSVSPLEIVLRGSAVFWFLFAIFRFVLRREIGAVGMADVLVIVLIADASQNAMAGESRSISDGFALIATIVFWNYLLDWAVFRFDKVAKVLEPPPLVLVRHGRIIHHNLRREMIGVDDLVSKLRERGIDRLDQVKLAMIESSGEVSVIPKDGKPVTQQSSKQTTPGAA
jgi:uncharacterized membrane protein YcaP (DUF421 family)